MTAAQKYNWLSKEEFDIIKPFDTVTSLSSTLSTDSDLASRLVTLKEEKNPYGKDTNYVSPSVLVKEIQKLKILKLTRLKISHQEVIKNVFKNSNLKNFKSC